MRKLFIVMALVFSAPAFANPQACPQVLQPAGVTSPLDYPGYTQWDSPRLFTDEEATQIVYALMTATGQAVGEIPLYGPQDRLAGIIGPGAAYRIRQYAAEAIAGVKTHLIPYNESIGLQVSYPQTFIRWNTIARPVNDAPHIDGTAVTILKRELMPERQSGTELYMNGQKFSADPTKILVFNGSQRWPRLVSNGYQNWYEPRPGILHGAGPSRGLWDLAIFVSLR